MSGKLYGSVHNDTLGIAGKRDCIVGGECRALDTDTFDVDYTIWKAAREEANLVLKVLQKNPEKLLGVCDIG